MKQLLQTITADPNLEARWLHTLSLLEHIGARKIGQTVAQTHPDINVLEHLSDEVRHAYVFKRLSQELAGNSSVDYLCREAAIEYFQCLDHQLSDCLLEHFPDDDHYPNYLLTTAMIERRAMQLYPLYRDTTRQDVVRDELVQIIAEEASHRTAIERALQNKLATLDLSLEPCLKLEETLFQNFCRKLGNAIHSWSTATSEQREREGEAPQA